MQEVRKCKNCSQSFTIEPDDFGFYEQMRVPAPTWCPLCRMMRRLSWFGYRILHKRRCDFTGEDVITVYHPEVPNKVYRQDIWWSDKWDPKSYGKDYDFSRSFFDQFMELYRTVPLPALHSEYSSMVNSSYCNAASELKNSYLAFKSDRSENIAYTTSVSFLKDCLETTATNHCELNYEVINNNKCYEVFFSQDCEDCHNVWFSRDLVGCFDCIGCINLRGKKYHIFNQPYTKEEYLSQLQKFNFGSADALASFRKQADEFMLTQPRKNFHNQQSYGSSGDYLYNTKNCRNCYWASECEDLRYCQLLQAQNASRSYDYTAFAFSAEWIYESCWVGINTQNVKFSFWNYSAHDIEYCFGCHGAGNLFGCVGLRKGEYCILNKQYTKEEYEELLPKIKQQMMEVPFTDKVGREYRYGEFWPMEFCPWGYNETTGFEFIRLSKEEALAQGFNWRDDDKREYREATMQTPDHVKDVPKEILKAILKCKDCGKNYQIIPMELQFLRRFNIPIPRACPLCRHFTRLRLLNPMSIYNRSCAKCSKAIETSYAPERPEIVYCESCYQQEVV